MINPEEFPTVFRNGIPAFGFRIGSGWTALLREAFGKVELFLQEHPEHQDSFKVLDVKSKFGSLRIYTSSRVKEINDILGNAIELSLRACETCGDTASEETSTDYYTSCFEHGPKTLIEPE